MTSSVTWTHRHVLTPVPCFHRNLLFIFLTQSKVQLHCNELKVREHFKTFVVLVSWSLQQTRHRTNMHVPHSVLYWWLPTKAHIHAHVSCPHLPFVPDYWRLPNANGKLRAFWGTCVVRMWCNRKWGWVSYANRWKGKFEVVFSRIKANNSSVRRCTLNTVRSDGLRHVEWRVCVGAENWCIIQRFHNKRSHLVKCTLV